MLTGFSALLAKIMTDGIEEVVLVLGEICIKTLGRFTNNESVIVIVAQYHDRRFVRSLSIHFND